MKDSYKIFIEKGAQNDLINIYDNVINVLLNSNYAIKLLKKINEKFEVLKQFPKSAPLIDNEYVKNKNLRKLLIDNYIAFYEVDETNLEIKIVRIINGMMNYFDIL